MGRFMDIAKGTLARHPVEFTIATGESVKVAVSVLLDGADEEIDKLAREHAKKLGVEDPKPGNSIYDRAADRYTLLLSCTDPDSPDAAPVPFFASEEEIREGLDRDRISYLVTAQAVWQDQCSPRQLKLSPDEYIAKVVEVATSESERPFLLMRPGLQWIFMRSLAAQCMSSPELRLPSGLGSVTSMSSSGKPLAS